MTAHRTLPGARRVKGFSLIELMIAMAIGLIIIGAALSAYLGASKATQLADTQGRMNEDAQAALSILTQQLQMAGNNPVQAGRGDDSRHNPVYGEATYPTGSYVPSHFFVRGCDGAFSNVTTAANIDSLQCATGASDAIAVSYEADRFNTVATKAADLPTDCMGFELAQLTATFPTEVPHSYYVADNRFYIATSASQPSPSLYCKGNGIDSTARSLVENIENMQITYGAVNDSTDIETATVAGYLSATELINLSTVPNDPEPWKKAISVRICVLVRSAAAVVANADSAKYYNCATPSVLVSAPDLRLRRAYTTTVVLRNRRL